MPFVVYSYGSDNPARDVPEEKFRAVIGSVSVLASVLAAEEVYDMIVQNYADLEKMLMSSSIDFMLFRMKEPELRLIKNNLARQLSNVMTAARTYVDTIPQHAERVKAGGRLCMIGFKSAQFDQSLSYRVMEKLRNYAQHHGLPFEYASFDRGKDYRDDGSIRWRYGIIPRLDAQTLREDGSFNKTVLAEIEGLGQQLELMPIVREYVQGLSVIHGQFREFCNASVDQGLANIVSLVDEYCAAEPTASRNYVAVGRLNDDGTIADQQGLHVGRNEYWPLLRNRNRILERLKDSYINW